MRVRLPAFACAIILLVGSAVLLIGLPRQTAAQTTAVTIYGRVTQMGGHPVVNALVVISARDRPGRDSTHTDATGRYTSALPGRIFDVSFSAAGFITVSLLGSQSEGDSAVQADAHLQREPIVLESVRVSGNPRRRPPLRDAGPSDVGDVEQSVNQFWLEPGEQGNLAALAASLPGVIGIPGDDGTVAAFSVLGLPPSQNNITIDGLSFGAMGLPRGTFAVTRVATSPYDVSVGGFSGAQLSLRTLPGSNYALSSLLVLTGATRLPGLAGAGAGSRADQANVQVSGFAGGAVADRKLYYNTSFQAGRRTFDGLTLFSAGAPELDRAGVSRAVLDSLAATIRLLGIPLTPGNRESESKTTNGSALVRLDLAPTAERTLYFLGSARWAASDPTLLPLTGSYAQVSSISSWDASGQFEYARYLGSGLLYRVRSGISSSAVRADGRFMLPAAHVRIGSQGDRTDIQPLTLQFGGASGLPRAIDGWTSETVQEGSWYSRDSRHFFKATASIRADWHRQAHLPDRLGSFVFNTLGDVAANRPALFTRSFGQQEFRASSVSGAVTLGDLWTINERLQIQFGARVEGARFTPRPVRNDALGGLIGATNDELPGGLHPSPRIGFRWTHGAEQQRGTASARPQPRGVLRGGIGEFRSLLLPSSIIQALAGTGLPGALNRIACFGSAAPVPVWTDYLEDQGTVPDQCAVPTASMTQTTALPSVTMFDRDFGPPRSWRGSVGWSGRLVRNMRVSGDAIYSVTLNQQGIRDLNLASEPRFTLPYEGNRPVYVDLDDVSSSSALIDSRAARPTQQLGRVSLLVSDLSSTAQQVVFSVSPAQTSAYGIYNWSIGYAYGRVRESFRGFDGAAYDDPDRRRWSRASGDIRHHLTARFGMRFANTAYLSLFGQVRSGIPFTPMVSDDINGDGWDNDRAFVPDPATTDDALLAEGISERLANAPQFARLCLREAIGGVTARNACDGPWTTAINGSISVSGRLVRLPERARVTLHATNILAGLDQLLHGSTQVRGWGQAAMPDPVLLVPQSFDRTAQRFTYRVNPAFGESRATRSAYFSPFRMAIEVSLPLGAPRSDQTLRQLLEPGRTSPGETLSSAQIKQRLSSAIAYNPMRSILAAQSKLGLSEQQVDSIQRSAARYSAFADSTWTVLSVYLAALDDNYVAAAARRATRFAQARLWDKLAATVSAVRATLTSEQLRRLDPSVREMLKQSTVARMRNVQMDY